MKSTIDPLTAAAMAVTVLAFSATAPLTAAATAAPLAMAFWRNALGFATLGPFLLTLRRGEVARVARGERGVLRREQWRPMLLGFLAATSLALHFAAFMTSARLTTVAMSTALVSTVPIWQALIAAGQGVRVSRRVWTGLGLAVAGAVAAGGLDVQAGGSALLGDLLALLGAVALAGYNALSAQARTDLSTPLYSTATALVCGLQLLAVCWLAGIPLTGFDGTTQLALLGLLVLPQLLGLGSLNFALGRISATTMSVALLLETPIAAITAWWLLGQRVETATMFCLGLIIVGVSVVVTGGDGQNAEHAAARRGRHRRQEAGLPATLDVIRPYAAAVPHLSAIGGGPGPGIAEGPAPRRIREGRPDPRIGWARLAPDDSPTITLAHHGAGAFDTLYLRRPPGAGNEPAPPPPAGTRRAVPLREATRM